MAKDSVAEKLFGGNTRTSPVFESIDWQQPLPESLLIIRKLFEVASLDDMKRAVVERRNNLPPDEALILEAASAERPLMLKHCVALGDSASPAKIWVHEYRPEAWAKHVGVRRHIERFHNHRMGLVSLILRGGYTADEFVYTELPEKPMDSTSLDDWGPERQGLVAQTVVYGEGDVMSLHPDEIHRLREIQPNTVTLVFDTPRTRDRAYVFTDNGKEPQITYPDMGGHYNSLSGRLGLRHE